MDLTLQNLFGEGASQDEQVLKISKADLQGLTASVNNRTEQLFVAILLKARLAFEGEFSTDNDESIVTENGEPLYFSNLEFYAFLRVFYWRKLLEPNKIINQFVCLSYEANQ
ncbi:hypothetical protein [Mastigocladopsis repens]|uniref:hypothetical protein n=1 Tax=Mastigocladopsis repens TaxID=221287 RepID=UPI0002E861B8|nr:hypothetical protein [Mastigocladopsis repens]